MELIIAESACSLRVGALVLPSSIETMPEQCKPRWESSIKAWLLPKTSAPTSLNSAHVFQFCFQLREENMQQMESNREVNVMSKRQHHFRIFPDNRTQVNHFYIYICDFLYHTMVPVCLGCSFHPYFFSQKNREVYKNHMSVGSCWRMQLVAYQVQHLQSKSSEALRSLCYFMLVRKTESTCLSTAKYAGDFHSFPGWSEIHIRAQCWVCFSRINYYV